MVIKNSKEVKKYQEVTEINKEVTKIKIKVGTFNARSFNPTKQKLVFKELTA